MIRLLTRNQRHPHVALQRVREVLALEVLHHQIGLTLRGIAEVGDVDDVIVADQRGRARLPEEALHVGRVAAVIGAQDLDRDLLADDHVRRQVHRAHAALADQAQQLVALAQQRADQRLGLVPRVLAARRQQGLARARRRHELEVVVLLDLDLVRRGSLVTARGHRAQHIGNPGRAVTAGPAGPAREPCTPGLARKAGAGQNQPGTGGPTSPHMRAASTAPP
jgi:hypothetical protein